MCFLMGSDPWFELQNALSCKVGGSVVMQQKSNGRFQKSTTTNKSKCIFFCRTEQLMDESNPFAMLMSFMNFHLSAAIQQAIMPFTT